MKWYEVECRNGLVVVRDDNGESVISDATGNVPQLISPQWQPTRVLGLGADISLLFLEQRVGYGNFVSEDQSEPKGQGFRTERTTGWLLTSGYRFGTVVDGTDDSTDFATLRKTVTDACVGGVLGLLTTQNDNSFPIQPMRRGEREVLSRLLTRLNIRSALTLKSLEEFLDGVQVTLEMLDFGAKAFENFVQGLVTPDVAPANLPSNICVTHIRHLPLNDSQRESAHIYWTNSSACPLFICIGYKSKLPSRRLVLVPHLGTIFGEDFSSENAIAFLDRALASLFLTIMSSFVCPFSQSYQTPDRGGLLLAGLKNFGHGIWEEMQTIERALQLKSHWTNLPIFYVCMQGGAALYRPLEHLYPELEGRFVYLDTIQDIIHHAFANGVQLFRRKGFLAMRATRDRIIREARRHGESRGGPAKPKSSEGLVVVFGLRMLNRRPVDALGFYVRLAEALSKRFGRLCVIFDGMNVDPDTGNPAAPVINAHAAGDGRRETELEAAFVARFRSAVSNLPIDVQSCIGLPIWENLFWLSQAHFFVAPNGGGLAKLRWALDIPGYVLTSRTNLEFCLLVNIYGDNSRMEEPFTPIYMNSADDVEDVPATPPRLKRLKRSPIPYPDNFIVSERVVIPQICDLIDIIHRRTGSDDRAAIDAT